MKIRTRLLLFLLPPLIGGIALISILSAYHLKGAMTAELFPSEERYHECLLLIFGSAAFTILIMVGTLYWIASRLTRPVQKLNNSALAIAAGQYGQSIEVQGPKEIVEFANTLNTMSECLLENINRLKDNSRFQERVHSEYECAMLLQHLMLQKNIDECRSDAFAVKPITFFSENPRGVLLDFPKNEPGHLIAAHLAEADQKGFEGMYQLLTQYKYSKESQTHTSLLLDRETTQLHAKGPFLPFIWSLEEKRFLDSSPVMKIESGDFFFLFNEGLSHFYKDPQKIKDLLAKVLKVFAQDGLETTAAMLQKELAFATKRKELEKDIHLLCFQILNV